MEKIIAVCELERHSRRLLKDQPKASILTLLVLIRLSKRGEDSVVSLIDGLVIPGNTVHTEIIAAPLIDFGYATMSKEFSGGRHRNHLRLSDDAICAFANSEEYKAVCLLEKYLLAYFMEYRRASCLAALMLIDVCIKGVRKTSVINAWRGVSVTGLSTVSRIVERFERLGILCTYSLAGNNDKTKLLVAPIDDFFN